MQQIKMIGLDLDGTLLNTKKELTENTRRVLREAIDAGVWLCLVPAFYAVWLISADRNTAADTPAVTRSTASDGSSFRNLSYKKKEA